MNEFVEGTLLREVVLADGAIVRLTHGGPVALGSAKDMRIVMGPSHGGTAPWIHIMWHETGYPSHYVNMATVQRVVLEEGPWLSE